MGLLPLALPATRHPERLALRPGDRIEIDAEADALVPRAPIAVAILCANGGSERFTAQAEVEHEREEIGRTHVRNSDTNAILVCRILLDKKKIKNITPHAHPTHLTE